MIILAWIILSILVGSMGSSKTIGGTGAFFISLIFSPIIGLLFVIGSSEKVKGKIQKIDPKIAELTKKAYKLYNNQDYKNAINIMQEALTYNAKDSQTHYNLSSLFSIIKEKEKAFFHLEKAVEFGYKNFNNIVTSENFEWLRNQSEYNEFITNGYKFDKTLNLKNSYLDELKELSKLKESGIITEIEFDIQKEKILNFRL